MSERNYYCLCDDNCRFPTMTTEQILAAIAQAVETGVVINPDTGFITKLKETNSGDYITFWVGTRAQYNALEKPAKNCVYIITDDTTAKDYENVVAELQALTKELQEAATKKESAGLVSAVHYVETEAALDTLIENTAHTMGMGSVKILSVRCGFAGGDSAQVTIHKGDASTGASVDVEVLLHNERYNRHAYYSGATLVWNEWEYENAQLISPKTYCTSDRYKGKPVYTRIIDYGEMQESGSRSVIVSQCAAEVVGVKVIATKNDRSEAQQLPFISDDGRVLAFAKITDLNDEAMCVVTVTDDMSGYSMTIVVEYIKQ